MREQYGDMTDPLIEVHGLVKTFGSFRALDGLDLVVQPGEVHGFLGPNGAGKSTTIRVLLGLPRAQHARLDHLPQLVVLVVGLGHLAGLVVVGVLEPVLLAVLERVQHQVGVALVEQQLAVYPRARLVGRLVAVAHVAEAVQPLPVEPVGLDVEHHVAVVEHDQPLRLFFL